MTTTRSFTPLSKHWCFTINNPTEDDKVDFNESTMDYMVVGKEGKPPTTTTTDVVDEVVPTPHLQGYIVFKTRKRRAGVAKILPRAFLVIANGTPEDNLKYCSKEGDFVVYGAMPLTQAQGASVNMKRNWTEAWDLAVSGKIDEIQKDMAIPYYHSCKRIRQDHPETFEDLPATCGIWFVGPTGCGKSRRARREYPDYYDKPLNKWWDGYRGEPNVIIDDLGPESGEKSSIGILLKRWTDHYSFPAEQKGTTIQIRPKQIIVTSQYTIGEVFASKEDPPLIEALIRRFDVINMFPPCP